MCCMAKHLIPEYSALASQWPVEFRVPGGRVRVRLWARDVVLPEVRGWRVSLGGDPGIELAPSGSKALVVPVVDRPRHRRSGQLPRLHAASGGDRRFDRRADLEIKGVRVHPQVVRENRTGGGYALGGNGVDQLG